MDQSLFAAPHGFSQRITSFIACACQGIHQLPLFYLIVLIANAHPYLGSANLSFSLALKGVLNLAIRANLHLPHRPVPRRSRGQGHQKPGYLLQPGRSDAINVFDPVTLLELRRAAHLCQILRPASRDQIRYRAVRQR
jgi:hypothetical protein